MSTVEFEHVAKRFGGAVAVKDFTLTIRPGELVTLLGPSGCGKTTTLNLLAGFEYPEAGAIRVDGQSIESLPPHRRDTALVFQGYALFPHLTVARNVAFGLEIRKRPRDEITRRVGEVLELVQLAGFADHYPRQLSGGQQQRVAIARALAIEPRVLLLDEPLSNLDAKLREEMRGEIRALQQKTGITAMYVTHDQEEALSISDRVVVMNAGLIEQVGTPRDIYRAPASPFVANFIGGANLIPVRVCGFHDGEARVVEEDGLEFLTHVEQQWRDGAAERTFAITAAGEFLGVVGIGLETGVLGYWLKREARDQGWTTRAVIAVVAWARGQGVTGFSLTTHPDNVASQRVALKAGFREIGPIDEPRGFRDGTTTAILFELAGQAQ